MRKISFLCNLHLEEKIELVEPSDEICDSYLKKSKSYLESSKLLDKSGKLEEAVSMSYYSMYHCVLALLFKCGIKCENHAASIILLKELFKNSRLSELLSFGKKERIDKQYYVDFHLTKEDSTDMIKKAEEFTIKCRTLVKETDENKINLLRKELKESLG